MFLSGKFTNYAKVGWWSDEWRCQSLLLGNDTKTKQMTLRSSALHCFKISRDTRIRTWDPLLPKQVR